MFALINDKTVVKFPYDSSMLKRDNPNVSFSFPMSDKDLEEWNVVSVIDESSIPIVDSATKRCDLSKPHLVNDKWVRTWDISDMSKDEIAKVASAEAESIRNTRNNHLAASDWTQLSDAVLSDKEKATWVTYRQELRDLSAASGFPHTMTWPTKPS